MSVFDSILVALFVMAVVFSVLGILWAVLKVFSFIFKNKNE